MSNSLRIKNLELDNFMGFLLRFELTARESRQVSRFIKLLNSYGNRYEEEYFELAKANSYLDENGNPLVIEGENGQRRYDLINKEKFNLEHQELLNEECIIEITEERKEMFKVVRDIILNCEMKLKGAEILVYDRYCEIVEEVNIE